MRQHFDFDLRVEMFEKGSGNGKPSDNDGIAAVHDARKAHIGRDDAFGCYIAAGRAKVLGKSGANESFKIKAGSTEMSGSRSRRLAFTYTGPDGREYRRAASVSIGKWAEYEEGSAIALICLPDDPGVSAPAWLVDLAREALAKKGRL